MTVHWQTTCAGPTPRQLSLQHSATLVCCMLANYRQYFIAQDDAAHASLHLASPCQITSPGTRRIPKDSPFAMACSPICSKTSRAASLRATGSRLLLCFKGLANLARSTFELRGGFAGRLGECNWGPIKSAFEHICQGRPVKGLYQLRECQQVASHPGSVCFLRFWPL